MLEVRRNSLLEASLELQSHRLHPAGELSPRDFAVSKLVPVVKDEATIIEQLAPDLSCRASALGEPHELPEQVCPANLPKQRVPERKDRGPVADQNARARPE